MLIKIKEVCANFKKKKNVCVWGGVIFQKCLNVSYLTQSTGNRHLW